MGNSIRRNEEGAGDAAIKGGRSPIRWAGSKAKLLPVMAALWPDYSGKYIEAFAGSASFFFNFSPRRAILNDSNSELITAFRVLRDVPRLLHWHLNGVPISPEVYYCLRSKVDASKDAFQSALRFFYLNRFSFNGIYRTNSRGEFNVPFGGGRTGGFPDIESWVRASDQLKRASLLSQDFESAVLDNVSAGDLVYMDPPYAVSNSRIFSQYSAQTFGLSDIERLASVMRRVDSSGAKFIVSYAESPESSRLARGWRYARVDVARNVAGFSRHRRTARELIITNDDSYFR